MPDRETGAPLADLHILLLGADVATRFAGWSLAASGACQPGRKAPDAASDEAAFERQVSPAVRVADFEGDAPYDVVLGAAASLAALASRVPARLGAAASTVEVDSPLPAATTFDDALIQDMALWARSGLGFLTREVDDDLQSGLPALPMNRQPSLLAGIAAATAAVSAAIERQAGGAPRRIAFDRLELLALLPMQPIAFAQITERIVGRGTAATSPGGTIPSADGLVYMRPVEPAHWAGLLRLVGGLDWAADAVERTPGLLAEAYEEIDGALRAWALAQTSAELVATCQAAHIPAAPVARPDEALRDAHLAARGFFSTDEAGTGVSLPWIARIDPPAEPDAPPVHAGERIRPVDAALPLAGLRVLDLTWAWAGPVATTMLADLGAEVVNIEWHPRASNLRMNAPYAYGHDDSPNTAGWWSANQRGKLSVGVNLKEPQGKQIIRELAARSDVVVENFSPGVVGRLGVGYDDLLEANPRLVYVSLSAFGQTGPHSHYIGYGAQLYAAAGSSFATTRDGEHFSQMLIPYPDPVSGLAGAAAIAAYVYRARVAGQPAHVDVSELESLCCVLLEPLLAAARAGDGTTASAGRDQADPPGYVVVTAADDRFIALLTRAAADRAAFAAAIGAAERTADGLRAAAARLDADHLLQAVAAAGLTAAPIHDSAECLRDPWLTEREFWVPDASPEIAGAGVRIGGALWHVDGRRAEIWRGAPQLFGETRTVLDQLLSYDAGRIDDLLARGVVA